jgi:hypothetical protein
LGKRQGPAQPLTWKALPADQGPPSNLHQRPCLQGPQAWTRRVFSCPGETPGSTKAPRAPLEKPSWDAPGHRGHGRGGHLPQRGPGPEDSGFLGGKSRPGARGACDGPSRMTGKAEAAMAKMAMRENRSARGQSFHGHGISGKGERNRALSIVRGAAASGRRDGILAREGGQGACPGHDRST